MSKYLNLKFASTIKDVTEVNSSFDKAILRICYTGLNRNKSYISKDAIERAIPSMYNCPIVCNYSIEDDNIGGHDIEIVETKKGMTLVNLTHPVGIVPQGSEYWWEEIDEGGETHEYLNTNILLWKRVPAYSKLKEDGIENQSMEINVLKGGVNDSDVYVIDDFEFTAFCLLGEDIEPCFESASIQIFSKDETRKEYLEFLNDLKHCFSDTYSNFMQANKAVDINSLRGGENLNKTSELNSANNQFALTIEQMKSYLVLDIEKFESIKNGDWEYPRYSYLDLNTETNEVCVIDNTDGHPYAFPYSISGDSVKIDFECKRKKKFVIADFEDGDVSDIALVSSDGFSERIEKLNTKVSELEAQLANKTSEAEQMKESIVALESYKAQKTREERTNAVNEVFSRFSDLKGDSLFDSLCENNSDKTIEEIENACFAIRGRRVVTQSGNTNPIRVSVENLNNKSESPYGDLFERFG